MRNAVSALHRVISGGILVAVIAEFFFAGMGVFHASSFEIHRITGESIWFASVLLLLLSLIGRMGRKPIGFSVLLFVLMTVQSVLVSAPQPFIAALHPVNALAIMGTAAYILKLGATRSTKTL